MARKDDLQDWIITALRANEGRATGVEIAKHIWRHHESTLRQSNDLFYTWQYDMRWAANILRSKGLLKDATSSPKGVWELGPDGES